MHPDLRLAIIAIGILTVTVGIIDSYAPAVVVGTFDLLIIMAPLWSRSRYMSDAR